LGTSRDSADVQRTPRFVAWVFVLREEGIQAEGEGENPSYLTGIRRETASFMA
jgi:hypothetical protein